MCYAMLHPWVAEEIYKRQKHDTGHQHVNNGQAGIRTFNVSTLLMKVQTISLSHFQ
jgi:hypothetical protein